MNSDGNISTTETAQHKNRANPTLIASLFFVTTIPGLVFNATLSFAYFIQKPKKLEVYLLSFLATGDFIVSACMMTIAINQYFIIVPVDDMRPWCIVYFCFLYFGVAMGSLSLLHIGIHRYILVVHPRFYRKYVNNRVGSSVLITNLVGASVVCSLIVGLSPTAEHILFHEYYFWCHNSGPWIKVFDATCTFVPLLGLILVYVGIFLHYRTHSKRVSNLRSTGQVLSFNASNNSELRVKMESIKLIKTLLLIIFSYCVCFVPYLLKSINLVSSRTFLIYATACVSLTSVFDPVIYFLMNRGLRNQVRSYLFGTKAN